MNISILSYSYVFELNVFITGSIKIYPSDSTYRLEAGMCQGNSLDFLLFNVAINRRWGRESVVRQFIVGL